MNDSTRTVTAVFGIIAGLAGLEHGVGEILQGSVRPDGIMILSWPDSSFFSVVSGEPAMTLVPDMLVTGILAVLVSVAFMFWAVMRAHRPYGALGLATISVVWLLVGGGFGPPLLGLLLSAGVSRARSHHRWAARVPWLGRALSSAWAWVLAGAVAVWLLLMPGIPVLAYSFGVRNDTLVMATIASAFSLLGLSIFAAYARDAHRAAAV